MIKESQIIKDFKAYVAVNGYKAVKVWENRRGVYARILGWTDKNNPNFSQVLSGGTTVHLSYEDIRQRSLQN